MKKTITLLLTLLLVFSFASCDKKEDKVANTSEEIENAQVDTSKEEVKEKNKEENKEEGKEESKEADEENSELKKATDFILKDSEGNDIRLSDYEGKVIIVNLFTSWCRYCLGEMPEFDELAKEYPDDLAIVLVDVYEAEHGENASEIYSWYDSLGYSMPMGVDENSVVSQIYPVASGFPTSYVIDKNFNLVSYIPGAVSKSDLETMLGDLLDE